MLDMRKTSEHIVPKQLHNLRHNKSLSQPSEAEHPFMRHLKSCRVSILPLTPSANPQQHLALFLISSRGKDPSAPEHQDTKPQQAAAAAVCLWPQELQYTGHQMRSLTQDLLSCGHEVLLSTSGRVYVSVKNLRPEEVVELLHATAQKVTSNQNSPQDEGTAAASCKSPADASLALGPVTSLARQAQHGTSVAALQHCKAVAAADLFDLLSASATAADNITNTPAGSSEGQSYNIVHSSSINSSAVPGLKSGIAHSYGFGQMKFTSCLAKPTTAPMIGTKSGQVASGCTEAAGQQASAWHNSLLGSSSSTSPRSGTMSSHNKLCKAVLQLPNSPAHGHKLSLSYAKQQDEPRMALFEVYDLGRAHQYAELQAAQALAASTLADQAAATADAEDHFFKQNAKDALQALIVKYSKQRRWAQEFRKARRHVQPTRPKGWLANVRWFLHCKLRTSRFRRWAAHQHHEQAAREERQVAAATYLASGNWHAVRSAVPTA